MDECIHQCYTSLMKFKHSTIMQLDSLVPLYSLSSGCFGEEKWPENKASGITLLQLLCEIQLQRVVMPLVD